MLQIEKKLVAFWLVRGFVYLKGEICLASETSLPVIKKGEGGKKIRYGNAGCLSWATTALC